MQSTFGIGLSPDLGKNKTIHSLSNPCALELALNQRLVPHHSPSRYQIPSPGSSGREDRMIPEKCPAMLEIVRQPVDVIRNAHTLMINDITKHNPTMGTKKMNTLFKPLMSIGQRFQSTAILTPTCFVHHISLIIRQSHGGVKAAAQRCCRSLI